MEYSQPTQICLCLASAMDSLAHPPGLSTYPMWRGFPREVDPREAEPVPREAGSAQEPREAELVLPREVGLCPREEGLELPRVVGLCPREEGLELPRVVDLCPREEGPEPGTIAGAGITLAHAARLL